MRGADRGRPHGCVRRAFRASVWALAAAALLVLVARLFIGDVYPVSSASMRPTIYAGAAGPGEPPETEWVLVRYDRSRPTRGELVVVAGEGDGEPLVKRVLGLPGESVRLARGDLFVDGQPLGEVAPDRALVPLWDTRHQPWRQWWRLRDGGPWREADGALALDPEVREPLAEEVVLHLPARDGYLSPRGERVPGRMPVNDLVLELTVELGEADPGGGPLVLAVTEEGDTFAAVVRPAQDGARLLRGPLDVPLAELVGESLPSGVELLASGASALPGAGACVLRLANVDDRLRLTVDGRCVLDAMTPPNRPHARPGAGSEHPPPRARFAAGRPVRLTRARLLRDRTWAPTGRFAVDRELLLGPDEVFVLGDNTRASTDSRSFGPVRLERLTGRVEAVVWPPARLRRL